MCVLVLGEWVWRWREVGVPRSWKVGMSDCWHVGYFCVFAEVGAGVGEWGVCFLVFGESNLAIRHCDNFKFSYSDFPHSLNEGVQSTPCG